MINLATILSIRGKTAINEKMVAPDAVNSTDSLCLLIAGRAYHERATGGFYWSQVRFMVRSAAMRGWLQALLFAAYGTLTFYYLTVFHLHDPWFGKFLKIFFLLAVHFPRVHYVFWRWRLIFLTGPILGLCAWVLYRMAFHSAPLRKDWD
jgi:hypothetical protein